MLLERSDQTLKTFENETRVFGRDDDFLVDEFVLAYIPRLAGLVKITSPADITTIIISTLWQTFPLYASTFPHNYRGAW